MFKKISCVIVAVFSIVMMSVSAFAVTYTEPQKPPTDINLTRFTNSSYAQNFCDLGFGGFINACETNDFSNYLVTYGCNNSAYSPMYYIYYFTDEQIDKLEKSNLPIVYGHSWGDYRSFDYSVYSKFTHSVIFSDTFGLFPKFQDSNITLMSYVITNCSDERIVNIMRNANKSNYNSEYGYDIFCDNTNSITFADDFTAAVKKVVNGDSGSTPSEPVEPSKPKPQEPLVKPSNSGFVVYNTDIWNGFYKNIMGDMGNIIPACYLLFGIVFGIPFVLYIIRTITNITTGGDEDV